MSFYHVCHRPFTPLQKARTTILCGLKVDFPPTSSGLWVTWWSLMTQMKICRFARFARFLKYFSIISPLTQLIYIFCYWVIYLVHRTLWLRVTAYQANKCYLTQNNNFKKKVFQKVFIHLFFPQNMELFGTDWEMFDAVNEEPYGVQVQEIECPVTPHIMETVQSMINPSAPSESFGRDICITMVRCIESLMATQWLTCNVPLPKILV